MLRPIIKPNWRRRRAVIVSPMPEMGVLIYNDGKPDFDIFTYAYDESELDYSKMNGLNPIDHYKFVSEFWGESFLKLCKFINNRYEVVCFMNSDLFVTVTSLNKFFEINDLFSLDFSQPSLSDNSYYSHLHTKNIPGGGVVEVPFIEIMMPCLSNTVINEICKINKTTISGWGLDVYLFDYIRKKLTLTKPAVIHDCEVVHIKPIESNRIFSDGLSAYEQMKELELYLEANKP